jgi:hypothetical protein
LYLVGGEYLTNALDEASSKDADKDIGDEIGGHVMTPEGNVTT